MYETTFADPDLALFANINSLSRDPLIDLSAFDHNLAGFDAAENSAPPEKPSELQRILLAAAQPGTAVAGAVARELLAKSLKIADLAEKRALVTQTARQGYQKAFQQTLRLDNFAEQAHQAGAAEDVAALRQEALDNGRLAVRYQKVNALATGLTQNAMAQAQALQEMAKAVLAGRPDAAGTWSLYYNKLSQSSERIRDARQAQLSQGGGLQGFHGLDSLFEGELDGLEGRIGRRIRGRLKKVRKYVLKPIRTKVLKPVGEVTLKAAKKVGKIAAKIYVGLPCKIMKSKVAGAVLNAAGTAVGTVFGGPAGGAGGAMAGNAAHVTQKATCGALDKIGITKGEFHRGSIRGALKDAAKDIAKNAINPKQALAMFSSMGGGGMAASGGQVLNSLMGSGGDVLQTFAQNGGGQLLATGRQAFQKAGLPQRILTDRMQQVAKLQVRAALQPKVLTAIKGRTTALVSGATYNQDQNSALIRAATEAFYT